MYKQFGCLSKLAMRYTDRPLIDKVTDTAGEIDGTFETPGSVTSSILQLSINHASKQL